MKTKKFSLLLGSLVVLGFVFTSCGGGKSALVGRWLLTEGSGFDDVELLKDGTGIVDGNEVSWKVEKNRMYVTHPSRAMSFDYQLTDSKLTLTDDDGDTLIYLKLGGSSALAGKWIATEETGLGSLEFTKDGRGNIDGGSFSFKWAADKKTLFITSIDTFEYKVSGSTLTLTSPDYEGLILQFKKE